MSSPPEEPDSKGTVGGVLADVSLGDVVRAWQELGTATAEERGLVAEVLGFEYSPPATGDDQPSRSEPPATTQPLSVAGTRDSRSRTVTAIPPSPIELPLELREQRTSPPQTSGPKWLQVDQGLEPERLDHLTTRPEHQPLFAPRWTRALVSAACATLTDDGPPDLERVIEVLSNGQPVTVILRERYLSVRRGMQLLVDVGENMVPFARDVTELVDQLLAVIGRDRTQLLYFADCPTLRCGSGGRATWTRSYTPPVAGTPIVVLTDLSLARGSAARSGATEDMWLTFLAIARAHDCPVIVFNPYPLDRWPSSVRRLVRGVPWDRGTTAAITHQAARGTASRA